MDKSIVTKYRIKKVLKVFSIVLLVLFLSLVVFGYVRTIPQDIKISNLSSSSFTVSWNTRFATNGSVFVIEEKNKLPLGILGIGKELFNDTRDVRASEIEATYETANKIYEKNSVGIYIDDFVTERSITNRGSYFTHHVEVKGLDPESEYSLMIGDGIFFYNLSLVNNEISISTDNIAENISTPIPAYGRIVDANNEEKTIEELDPVEDAVVYLNYLDETTGERSNVFSSSVNENGAWYVDLSSAVDKEGNNFVETYSKQITNIEMELVIDAGPLGKWERIISPETSSPLETLVLNIPGASYGDDIPDVLHRTDMPSDSTFVKGVSALEDGCKQIGFCSCGVRVDNRWENCACDADVMERRGCNGQTDAQSEAQALRGGESGCANGGGEGDRVYFGQNCLTCTKDKVGTVDKWRWKDLDESCGSNETGAVFTPKPVEVIKTPTDNDEKDSDEVEAPIYPRNCASAIPGDKCGDNGTCMRNNGGIVICVEIDKSTNSHKDGAESLEGKQCTVSGSNISNGKYDSNGTCISTGFKQEDIEKLGCKEILGYGGLYLQVDTSDGKYETYYCKGENFVKLNNQNKYAKCSPESLCHFLAYNDTCISVEGKSLECNWGKWTDEGKSLERNLYEVDEISPHEKCKYENDKPCICTNDPDTMLGENDYCKEVTTCKNGNDRKICDKDGTTCLNGECNGPNANKHATNIHFDTKVNAQEIDAEEYLIDQSTGNVLGVKPGIYTVNDGENTYVFSIKDKDIEGDTGDILIYLDENNNGIYDEGTDKKVTDLGSKVVVTAIKQTFKYQLREGYNFVSFPFVVEDETARTAGGFLEMINTIYSDSIYSIAKYDGTWKVVGGNGDSYDANDFQLVPGQGYILKAKRNLEISVIGKPVKLDTATDSAPISLFPGWNLIGTYGSNVKQYTAKSLIQSINSYEPVDFTADNVSRWESDVQRYDGFQVTNENGIDIEYGFDFPINTLQSYFVRILNGRGNWQQEVK